MENQKKNAWLKKRVCFYINIEQTKMKKTLGFYGSGVISMAEDD